MANEQLPSNSSPTLVSEPTSNVQTESDSSDASSDSDDDKSTEQSPTESVQSTDDQQSIASGNDDNVDEKNVKDESFDGADIGSQQSEFDAKLAAQREEQASIDMDEIRYKNLRIIYGGRDILDFSSNVANKSWHIQYAHLPEKNYQMYINNRSQYNRLASGYEHPEYALNKCGKCAFNFPVLADVPDKMDQTQCAAGKNGVSELLTHTLASMVSRDSPIQHLNAIAQKMSAQSLASSIHANSNGHSMNLNNFMLNNNAATVAAAAAAAANASSGQSYNMYQNRNQLGNAANNTNNHTCYKQNQAANAFYGNNVVLNALVNQIGNNINNNMNSNMNSNMNNNINNSSAFSANFMNALNSTNNNSNGNNGINTNQLNQLSNAALANLLNQNRQQQLYGMCRQNINKSGINFNANSHKSMPTYSHF